jgi:hypothetical protein
MTNSMKSSKLIIQILLAGSVLVGAASCKKKEGDAAAPAGEPSSAPKGAETPAAPVNSGVPECETYFKAMDKFVACEHVQPQAAKDMYKKQADQMRTDIAGVKDKTAAVEQCKKAMDDLKAGADARGCALQ